MTHDWLEELERLNAERTQGEWTRPYVICLDDEYAVGVEQGDEENSSFLLICDMNEEPDNYAANAAFIAAAANHMTTLLRGYREMREALEPFARAGECLDAYDPDFPDNAAILRASADLFMRVHGKHDAEAVGDLNKPLVAGDLRRARAALQSTGGKEQKEETPTASADAGSHTSQK